MQPHLLHQSFQADMRRNALQIFYFADEVARPFAFISDSSRATVSGNGSPAGLRTPGTPTPFARSSAVRPFASFACRSAPFSARNFTNGGEAAFCAAPCSAVWCGTADGLGT